MKRFQFSFFTLGFLFASNSVWSYPIVAEKNFAMNCMVEYRVSGTLIKEFGKRAIALYGNKKEVIGSFQLSALSDQTGFLLYASSQEEWTIEESRRMTSRVMEIWNTFYANKSFDETIKIGGSRTRECDSRLKKGEKDQMLKRMMANDEFFKLLPVSMQFNF